MYNARERSSAKLIELIETVLSFFFFFLCQLCIIHTHAERGAFFRALISETRTRNARMIKRVILRACIRSMSCMYRQYGRQFLIGGFNINNTRLIACDTIFFFFFISLSDRGAIACSRRATNPSSFQKKRRIILQRDGNVLFPMLSSS